MNRGLFYFGLLVIFLAASFGFYPVAILGIILLVASLFAGQSKPVPPSKPAPASTRTRPKQPVPHAAPQPAAETGEAEQPAEVSRDVMLHYAPVAQPTHQVAGGNVVIPALFPTTMFPAPPQSGTQAQPPEVKGEKREERDELVEAVAALIFLRLLAQGT